MIELFYTTLNILITPILLLNLLYRCAVGKEEASRVLERLGVSTIQKPIGKLVWIHAASVGEAMSVASLVKYLHGESYSILFTTFTLNSAKAVKKKYGETVIHQYLPIENYFAIKLFLLKWKPDLTLFVESEFWPVIIYQASKSTKVLSINTRVSDRSYSRWKSHNYFSSSLFSKINRFYPQSVQDLERLKDLGINNAEYKGNLKYAVGSLSVDPKQLSVLKKQIGERKIFFAFSTHENEEEIFIQVFRSLEKKYPGLLLIIAPRHPERREEILALIKKSQLKAAVRSKKENIVEDTQVYLADTIGELGMFFTLSKINVVGGSFNKNIGGHNPIEPAIMEAMTVMGPQHYNFLEIVDEFTKKDAMVLLKNNNDLNRQLDILLQNPEKALYYGKNSGELVKEKSKILGHIIKEIEQYLC